MRLAARSLHDTRAEQASPLYFGWTRYSAHIRDRRGLGFRASKQFPDEAAYLAHLWSPERMEGRSQAFLRLSVPLLQRMRDRHDYRHVVTYSPEMPDPWLAQLREAASRFDVLMLSPADDGPVTDVMRTTLREQSHGSRPAVWFRVDDDDLLSVDFLDRLDRHVRSHPPLWGVSLSWGYEGLWHDGLVSHVRETHRPLGSQGQACLGVWDADRGELDIPEPGNHRTLDRRVPSVLDSTSPTFVRLVHLGQDTRTDTEGTVDDLKARLQRNRSRMKDSDLFLQKFPTLRGVFEPDV